MPTAHATNEKQRKLGALVVRAEAEKAAALDRQKSRADALLALIARRKQRTLSCVSHGGGVGASRVPAAGTMALRGLAVLALTTLAVACGASTEDLLRRASFDLHCPAASIHSFGLGGEVRGVRGCGHEATYVFACTHPGYAGTCAGGTWVLNGTRATTSGGDDASAADAASPIPDAWSDAVVQRLRDDIAQEILGCLPSTTQTLELRVAITEAGTVRRMGSELTGLFAGCVDACLARHRPPGRVRDGRRVAMRFTRQETSPAVAGDTPPDGVPFVVPEDGTAPADGEADIRAAIDGRAPAILACAHVEALALQVQYTAEGALTVQLDGALHGGPEEACVSAIVGTLHVRAPGRAGALLHAVQR